MLFEGHICWTFNNICVVISAYMLLYICCFDWLYVVKIRNKCDMSDMHQSWHQCWEYGIYVKIICCLRSIYVEKLKTYMLFYQHIFYFICYKDCIYGVTQTAYMSHYKHQCQSYKTYMLDIMCWFQVHTFSNFFNIYSVYTTYMSSQIRCNKGIYVVDTTYMLLQKGHIWCKNLHICYFEICSFYI